MSFDIEQVLQNMAGAISSTVNSGDANIKAFAKTILDNEKQSLKELGEARLLMQITDVVFNQEIDREKQVVEAQLLTLQIMTKALAQQAVNAAIDVFTKAIEDVI